MKARKPISALMREKGYDKSPVEVLTYHTMERWSVETQVLGTAEL